MIEGNTSNGSVEETPKINVDAGEFPYPIPDGPVESRYLTWVRNHSNYMAERGMLDYFRLFAVLLRGILINFLTLLPYLLGLSLVLGLVYKTMLLEWDAPESPLSLTNKVETPADAEGNDEVEYLTTELTRKGWANSIEDWTGLKSAPYLFTPIIVLLAGIWVILFPILTRLAKIVGYKRSLETGSSSSVKRRDLFERSFGFFLLLILGVGLLETFPLVEHVFHHFRDLGFDWETLPTLAVIASALVAANKLLSILGGFAKKLAIFAIGALGLVIPLMVVLFVVEFIVYADPYLGILNFGLVVVPGVISIGILFAFFLGLRSFNGKALAKLAALLLGMFGFLVGLVITAVVLLFSVDNPESYANALFVLAWTIEIWIFCWLAVDVNLTSINGLYRDRLASAFLVGVDTRGDVDIEQDIDLEEICQYETGSTAPYHIVNVALNLQGSKDIAIRERNSDFFIFSKRYIGSDRTGYCRSEHMEQVYPQIDLGTAMAISAAAASPNMGRSTNPLMVAFMTLLNVRLGFWIPNPAKLTSSLSKGKNEADAPPKIEFADVFQDELGEIKRRR